MRLLIRISLLAGIMACQAAALGAPSGQDPYIGYVYPAGGQQGVVFRVTLRGQRLSGARDAYISGKGVRASVVSYEGPLGPLNLLQQEELKRRLFEIRDKRGGGGKQGKTAAGQLESSSDNTKSPAVPVTLPDLPELRNLDQQTPVQLRRLAEKFLNRAKRPKPPIAEMVTLEVTVDPDAPLGDREIRLRTPAGLTNPLMFQIGGIPETREPDEEDAGGPSPAEPPIVLNGQIMPGEVDRFPLQLRGGQNLVVAVRARKLIPYLADAVPGWFQAVAALYDSDGKEVAFDDDSGFDPDPAFVFRVTKDGRYMLEIRDALYRGREDFVYRAVVADVSIAKPLFPTGTRGGVPIVSALDRDLSLKMARRHFGSAFSLLNESEPDNTVRASMKITLPRIISGVIQSPEDRDVFRFEGHAGDLVVAEIYARRMGSPLDSLLRLIDASGQVVAWNDDQDDVESGLLTHHADSYLMTELPATGPYYVQVSDAQRHGGPEYAYYLRIGPPRPDFALLVTPSSLNVVGGRAVAMTVFAVGKDGWDGDIDVTLKDAPGGFVLSGARIPKGRGYVRMTLTAPSRGRLDQPVALRMEGRAEINGNTVVRPVMPADNMMQAFAYTHLVPSEDLMVMVTRRALASPILDMGGGDRLRIPAGGSAQVSFSMRLPTPNAPIHLELSDPPAGVTLQDVAVTDRGFTLTLKADEERSGYADNLIVEAFTETDTKRGVGGSAQKQKVSIGVLPAIPFEIVPKGGPQP